MKINMPIPTAIKIDSKFINKWETKYDQLESDEAEYHSILKDVQSETTEHQTINNDTFVRIINWKSARTKGLIVWDDYSIYQKNFRLTLKAKDSEKLKILIALPGIGAPIASVLLHFMFPNVYPIYDVRTVETLNSFGYLSNKTVSVAKYPEFQTVIKSLRTSLRDYNLRQIDRALFSYHKINLGRLDDRRYKNTQSGKKDSVKHGKNIRAVKQTPSIPEQVKAICERLASEEEIIQRKDIINEALRLGLNEQSVLPADYCDNTKTGRWSKHTFLHALGPGKYIFKR